MGRAPGQSPGGADIESTRCAIELIAGAAKAGYSLDALETAYAPAAKPSDMREKIARSKKAKQ
jgi:hypothetical protein